MSQFVTGIVGSAKSLLVFSAVTSVAWLSSIMVMTAVTDVQQTAPIIPVNSVQTVSTATPEIAPSLFGQAPTVASKPTEPVKETTLKLELRGVFPASDPTQGMAVIAEARQDEKLYRAGDDVVRGVTLLEVYKDHVVLKRGERNETLFFERNQVQTLVSSDDALENLPQAAPVSATTAAVLPGSARATYQQLSGEQESRRNNNGPSHPLIDDINQLSVGQMIDKYEQRFQQDPQNLLATTGLEATGSSYKVTPGSPLTRIGLRVGDEILSVNGQTVGNIQQDMSLADLMRSQGVARIEMRRGERRFYVNYPIR
ncbi:hypothetical protein FJM67_10690 [Maribrevibacterium harenarium]|uniref:PDZ domain-containing protein n=1 Tax=Maribrevibacterium harenarium TaxID=2589817 RepID=A0A501WSQ2_9GAMM|nr:type II secretion system protein N [Maribrevibacterium harenarium]TPE50307.1 hypothetical protein FJM67_10690 [Maribrevibacterium harenarium]